MNVIITFMYLFVFPLGKIPLIDSSWIAMIILILYLIVNGKYRLEIIRIIRKKKVYYLLAMIMIICVYSAFITTILGARDYSFIITMLHQVISLVFGLFVIAFLNTKKSNILECIIYSFVIQGILQILSMYIPHFRDATNVFRPESAVIIGQWKYAGIRGMAISGNAFFSLAVAYGLTYILWAFYYDKVFIKKQALTKVIMLGIMVFGGFSAGRTSFIGLVIAIVVYLIKRNNNKRYITSKKVASYVGMIVGIILILVVFYQSGAFGTNQAKYLSNYILEIVRTGTTTSGDQLFNEMYFKLDFGTFILGTGRYSEANGAYYMDTDAGYMRVILYFGIIGFFLLLFLQRLYLYKEYGSNRINRAVIIGFVLIMQIKGEVVGFLIIAEAILLMFSYYEYNIYHYETELYLKENF